MVSEAIKKEVYQLEVGRNSETGLPRWLTIRLNGKLHSPPDDRPAQIVFDDQGRPKEMGWFHENLYHRVSGSALQQFNPENNVKVYEEHRKFGELHRMGSKAAWIQRHPETGDVFVARYFIDGKEVDPKPASTPLAPSP